jgi:hypothetical protein
MFLNDCLDQFSPADHLLLALSGDLPLAGQRRIAEWLRRAPRGQAGLAVFAKDAPLKRRMLSSAVDAGAFPAIDLLLSDDCGGFAVLRGNGQLQARLMASASGDPRLVLTLLRGLGPDLDASVVVGLQPTTTFLALLEPGSLKDLLGVGLDMVTGVGGPGLLWGRARLAPGPGARGRACGGL